MYLWFCGLKIISKNVISWSDSEIVMCLSDCVQARSVYFVAPSGTLNKPRFALALSRTYCFAEGSSRRNKVDGNFYEWVTVLNTNRENNLG